MSFKSDFLWGAASAAYQIEGAFNIDGKGPGIWDELHKGNIKHDENGNEACDHYHRYKEDISLMKDIGIKAYRFSISWPRIIPEQGRINEEGIGFYRDLVTELKSAGIEPICTLYHWDLPMWVHNQGGWRNPDISEFFASYVKIVVDALSDNVRYWITVNEPAAFVGNGYVTGAHAPFENGLTKPLEEMFGDVINLSKNVLLAHGKAVKVIRANAISAPKVGMALNGNMMMPQNSKEEDIELARQATFPEEAFFSHVNWWADPAVFGAAVPSMRTALSKSDLETICQPLDFFGFNCYNASNYDEYTGANPAVYSGMPRTAMEWPITPDVLYWAAKFLGERYGLPILITENGMANIDFVMSDGKVHDPQRIEYIRGYLHGLQKAADEGIKLIGYLYWSIMDNFEWAEGYDKRFGLIHIDYQTQKRTRKESSYWYSEVINANGIK